MFEWFQSLTTNQKILFWICISVLAYYLFYSDQLEGMAIEAEADANGYLGLHHPVNNSQSNRFSREYGTGGDVHANDPTMVMFFARWCGACKNTKPMWDLFTTRYDGYQGVRFVTVDGDKNPELMKLHGVDHYPTIKFVPHGLENPTASVIYQGYPNMENLENFMKGYIKKWRLTHYN